MLGIVLPQGLCMGCSSARNALPLHIHMSLSLPFFMFQLVGHLLCDIVSFLAWYPLPSPLQISDSMEVGNFVCLVALLNSQCLE